MFLFRFCYCHYYYFEYISEVLTFPIGTTDIVTCCVVLCFHMTLFNYGTKGVMDVDPTRRCHQSNIMLDIIISAKFVVVVFFVCVSMCVFRGDILCSFYS